MKAMKTNTAMKHKILLLLGIAAMFSLPTSCVHKGDLELEPIPDISFEYEINGLSYVFKSTVPGTTNVSWEVLGQGTGSGETFNFTFPKPGSYWVTMTGTYNGMEQSVSTKLLVAKPSVISLTDNTVADWDKVTYPDFMFTGQEGRGYAKFDYDAKYLYFLFVLDEGPGYGYDEAILNFRLDADDNPATGYKTASMGVEWYYEGVGWNHDPWGNMWTPESLESGVDPGMTLPIVWGFHDVVDGKTVMEFGLDRTAYGVNTTRCGLYMMFYTNEWSRAERFVNSAGDTSYHLSLDKTE